MERSIEGILKRSSDLQSPKLHLQCLNMKDLEQPDLSRYTWVTELDMSNNKLTKLNKDFLPPNVITLELRHNMFETFDCANVPSTVQDLDLSLNDIPILDCKNLINLERLNCSVCGLRTLVFPPNATEIDISNNNITLLDDFPQNLITMDCSNNQLSEFGKLNDELKGIKFSFNTFNEFPDFPDSVIHIEGQKNYIGEIYRLPHDLEYLDMKDNRITEIRCHWPIGLTRLNLADNILENIDDLPDHAEEIDLSSNKIGLLCEIPESVKLLDVSNNYLGEIPDELKARTHLTLNYRDNFCNTQSSSSSSDDIFDIDTFWSSAKPTSTYSVPNTTTYSKPYTINQDYLNQYKSSREEMASIYSNTRAKNSNPYYVSAKYKKVRVI